MWPEHKIPTEVVYFSYEATELTVLKNLAREALKGQAETATAKLLDFLDNKEN